MNWLIKTPAIVFGAIMIGMGVMTFAKVDASLSTRTQNLPLDEQMARIVSEFNKRKGESFGGVVLDGARVRGNSMIIDLTMPNAPARVDQNAASERLLNIAKSRYCNSIFTPAMKRGAGVVFRMHNKSGNELADAKIDATACRLPA